MKEISKETLEFIKKVLLISKKLKLENLIIEKNIVRGMYKEEGIFLLQNKEIPDLEFDALGITRVDALCSRFNLLNFKMTSSLEEKIKSTGERVVTKLVFTNAKTEVDFRCADIEIMPVIPRAFPDPVYYSFKLNKNVLDIISNAQKSMRDESKSNELISIIGSPDKLIIKVMGDGDTFKHIIEDDIKFYNEKSNKFAFNYKNKMLLDILNSAVLNDMVEVKLTARGFMNITVNGMDIYLLAEI